MGPCRAAPPRSPITCDVRILGRAPHSTSNASFALSLESNRGVGWHSVCRFARSRSHEFHHQLGLRRSYRVAREFNRLPLQVNTRRKFGKHPPQRSSGGPGD
jgi:hypothetical protein